MWIKTENSDAAKPQAKEESGGQVIVRKGFTHVASSDDRPEHWEYDEWQMPAEAYEVYAYYDSVVTDQSDALMELAELIAEVTG